MRILIFHPVPLPPRDYGGVERVVLWLAQGLRDHGHSVSVAALEGSRLPPGITLVPVPADGLDAVSVLSKLPAEYDVIHFMAPPGAAAEAMCPSPWLLTVHGNGKPDERYPRNTVFLSQDHARRHGGEVFVHNGIDPAEYRYNPAAKNGWNLFLSKTGWRVKNVRGAARLCRKARAQLRIAGGNRPWSLRARAFWDTRLRWEGPVSGAKKAELLCNARALVFPVLWPEPFGLVVAEALMSGTPVLASPTGSLLELVPKEVGALLGSEEEWVDWLSRETLPWSPEVCRSWALERFHFLKMAGSYENLYQRVIVGERLHEQEPVAPRIQDWRQL